MARRPSIPTSASFASPGQPAFQSPELADNTPALQSSHSAYPRSASFSKQTNDALNLDPDELFTKYTVSEVKSVQQRLRRDADAKQEELRLMVGERYRDLLQASTSIISLAQSSRRVLEALDEAKHAILAQEEPPMPRQSSTSFTANDKHLHTLQVLSAHMKLLLDAPEHLWRLIERKKYLPAAWLFLLARVVHRVLVRDDEQDETWNSQGVDVMTEFPLVQRQWDMVSQFRSQIIHKATLSLREADVSRADTCATLVTLHLLDSRPLSDTLSALLSQRSKLLQSSLSWDGAQAINTMTSDSRHSNGHARNSASTSTRTSTREIREAIRKALDTISQTISTARSIFEETGSQPSLLGLVLESIHSESTDSSKYAEELPPELHLTTQALLLTVISSAHFHLLPHSIRQYKPYIDLSSSSSSLPQSQFRQRLNEWFQLSTKQMHTSVEKWFIRLQNVKEVWSVRASIRKWVLVSEVHEEEKAQLLDMIDKICHRRVVDIWTVNLSDARQSFKTHLDSSTSFFTKRSSEQQEIIELSPPNLLYQPPSLSTLSQVVTGSVDNPFQKYQAALKRQLVGRTSLLDGLLTTLEQCALTIQQDLSHIRDGSNKQEIKPLVEELCRAYRPSAENLATDVVQTMEDVEKNATDDCQSSINGLVFLGRVADELGTSSSFISDIGCGQDAITDFQTHTTTLHDRIIDRWREYTVSSIIRNYGLLQPSHATLRAGPSPNLIEALLSLSAAVQQLGITRNPTKRTDVMQAALREFAYKWISKDWTPGGDEGLQDLAFLHALVSLQGPGWADISQGLQGKLKEIIGPPIHPFNPRSNTFVNLDKLQRNASDCIPRMQTLLAPLLPPMKRPELSPDTGDKLAGLLQYGIPSSDQQFHSAIDLAKPSPRFGLLLVGGSTT
ncbi:hypothetical protein BDQ12DRAFT_608918 [Crucibulum laeve]|uniref:Conserved oligomeric Golgi complex subunit 1 n=1 Tax=Crucibulum laeve TaxID=68775 RepID=A0A5C3LVY1_9AGAR|nr:hypothetical protein BDQ12DRAFT_608918 [Crucibulum laeve]